MTISNEITASMSLNIAVSWQPSMRVDRSLAFLSTHIARGSGKASVVGVLDRELGTVYNYKVADLIQFHLLRK